MKKRPMIICLVVGILGSVLFWLQSNYIITGWLKGEAFYQGRPTSYWRRELGDVQVFMLGVSFPHTGTVEIEMHSTKTLYRAKSLLPAWLYPIIGDQTSGREWDYLEDHPLLLRDPEARDVLTELLQDSTDTIREFAQQGLARINKD